MDIYILTGNGFEKMQYEVEILDKDTGKHFKRYFKDEHFLQLFKNEISKNKKLIILNIKDLYKH